MGDEELLQRARTSPHDWPPRQLIKLLESFGFKCGEGKDQTICRHIGEPDVYLAIPRHRRVQSHVVRKAVKLIEGLRDRGRESGA
jgi:hypothetical protein